MTKRHIGLIGIATLVAVLLAGLASADVKLPSVLGDNMVLQRNQRVPVWGWADAKEKVTVTFRDQTASTWADEDGTWQVTLRPLTTGEPADLTVAGKNAITLTNVLVGEVWVCSGQSNMGMVVRSCNNAEAEIASATYPNIRLFSVPRIPSTEPVDDCDGSWSECSPETVPNFTAAGYFFGRKLYQELGIPIGLINTSWGGTRCEAWTSAPGLEAYPELQPIADSWAKAEENYPTQQENYLKKVEEWKAAVEKAKADGKPQPRRPYGPLFSQKQHQPSALYNGMIQPLIPFAIRGAIWYQGESNAGRAYQYRTLFPAMISDWRENWGQGAFSFYFVQLANFMDVAPDPQDSAWAELREAQSMTLSLRNTGQAVIIDVGEAKDIHPKNKQDVGLRLALNALKKDYGQDIVFSGPTVGAWRVDGSAIRVYFDNVGTNLVAKDGEPVKGFAIAGEDQQFVWADAVIDGGAVVVSTASVANPVAVRYAWANNPVCNLYNAVGLPTNPFRTDEWPGVTINNK
ncbi:MAG TPA: sialate O-acetylesterase [Armatimonadota bacterium]|nr:sialate O-acetylesterase [Armatimonadota bacterium]